MAPGAPRPEQGAARPPRGAGQRALNRPLCSRGKADGNKTAPLTLTFARSCVHKGRRSDTVVIKVGACLVCVFFN